MYLKDAVIDWISGYHQAQADTQFSVVQFSDEFINHLEPSTLIGNPSWKSDLQNMDQIA